MTTGSSSPSESRSWSVVIATRDRPELLLRAVRSVLSQRRDLELIVVEDGSRDGSEDALKRLGDSRLRYVWQEWSGRCSARNRGAALASRELLTFLDSDDEALAGWLDTLAKALGEDRVAVACCGCEWRAAGRSKSILPAPLGPLFDGEVGRFLTGTFALRRKIFLEVGGYAPELHYSENTDLGLRLVSWCRRQGLAIESLDQVLIRVHETRGAPTPEDLERRLASVRFLLANHAERFGQLPRARATYATVAGVCAARLGRFEEARSAFRAAVVAQPHGLRGHLRLLIAAAPSVAARVWKAP